MFGPLNVVGYFWQIGEFQRRPIALNELHQVDALKFQGVGFVDLELLLGKVIGLFYKIDVFSFHLNFRICEWGLPETTRTNKQGGSYPFPGKAIAIA